MKIEQRNGSYRIQKMYSGKRYSITYDHKPSEAEIMRDLLELIESTPVKGSFFPVLQVILSQKRMLYLQRPLRVTILC